MKNIHVKPFGKRNHPQFITIVSGIPRSGTSLMMSMLAAGGLEVLTDNIRISDDDNLNGYFELEEVKKLLKGEHAWVDESHGKVVKVISTLLPYLPSGYRYRIIFMRRAMKEILASQRRMLINRGENPDKVSDDQMAVFYEKNGQQIERWIDSQDNATRIDISYNQLMENPKPLIAKINMFLGSGLDEKKMLGVIDPVLYRQRSSK
jgi:hypothetical protein